MHWSDSASAADESGEPYPNRDKWSFYTGMTMSIKLTVGTRRGKRQLSGLKTPSVFLHHPEYYSRGIISVNRSAEDWRVKGRTTRGSFSGKCKILRC